MSESDQAQLIGEVFPATDPISQWVVVLCMAVNDLSIADRHLHRAREAGSPEMLAYFRHVCSYLHELALHLRSGKGHEAVAKFLNGLGDEAKDAYGVVVAVESELSPARQSSFHYPKVGDNALQKAMGIVADKPAVFGVDDDAGAIRFFFADYIVGAFAFGDVEAREAEFSRLVERASDAVTGVATFARIALRTYREQRGLLIDGEDASLRI